MRQSLRVFACLFAMVASVAVRSGAHAQPASAAPAAAAASVPVQNLYAVEIKTGPNWDGDKPPPQQAYFREHSANLKKMRDQGSVVIGARYGDKGLVVVQAASAEEVHAMMKQDPSIQAKTFVYELHEFNVFYGGAVQPKKRS